MKFQGAAMGFSDGEEIMTHPDYRTHLKGSSLHAEMATLIRSGVIGEKIDTMLILRLNSQNNFSSSIPCAICKRALKMAEVQNLFVVHNNQLDLLTLHEDFYC